MAKKFLIVNKKAGSIPEILVYGFIDSDMAKDFATQIKALEKTNDVINVRINSEGGDVYQGIAMFNTARNAKCAVDMYIDGLCASMASALAMAGRRVYMSKYARLMTHKPSGFAGGNAEELRAVADEVDALEPILNSMYCEKTGLDSTEVTAKFLNGKDKFFSAQQAKDAGLVDDVYDGPAVNVPEGADIRAVYEAYQTKLTASINFTQNQDSDMRQISPAAWAQICAAMGITDSAEDSAIVAAIKKLAKDAADAPIQKAKAELAERTLTDYKAGIVGKNVKTKIAAALQASKITAKQAEVFGVHYAEDEEGLDEILATTGFTSITDQLNTHAPQRGGDGTLANMTPQVKALFDQGWDALHKGNKIGELKNQNEDAYLALYKSKFGYLPNEKPFNDGKRR